MAQVTIKTTEEAQQEFASIVEELKSRGKAFTNSDALNVLMDSYNNPQTVERDSAATLQRLKEAETLLHDLQTKQAANENAAAEYEQKITELTAQLQAAQDRLEHAEASNRQLEESSYKATEQAAQLETELRQAKTSIDELQLKPFPKRLLELTAEKLSLRYGKQVTPTEILSDMFLKYTIQQYNVWFYPFVLSDKVIVSVANSINPQITTMQQVKQLIK